MAPPTVRAWWRHLQGGQLDRAVAEAAPLAEALAADDATRGWVPAVVLATGAVLAAREEHLTARQYLREGLAMLPGTPSTDLVGTGAHHQLVLVELCLITGEPAEARALAEPLTEPGTAVEIRLGATRALARLRQASGDAQGAHWLLNAATDLAAVTRSHLLETLVEADRAAILAAQGRTWEAVRMADEAVERLGSAPTGPHGVMASTHAAATAATVARASAIAGDTVSATRLAADAHRAAARSGRRLPEAGALLADATLRRVVGDLRGADAAAIGAERIAADLAASPVAALATAERGLVALAAGRLQSAGPLLDQAVHDLRAAGAPAEAAQLATWRAAPHAVVSSDDPSGSG